MADYYAHSEFDCTDPNFLGVAAGQGSDGERRIVLGLCGPEAVRGEMPLHAWIARGGWVALTEDCARELHDALGDLLGIEKGSE